MRALRKAGLLRGINTLDSGNKEIICLFHTQRSPFKRRRGGGVGGLQDSGIFSAGLRVKSLRV